MAAIAGTSEEKLAHSWGLVRRRYVAHKPHAKNFSFVSTALRV